MAVTHSPTSDPIPTASLESNAYRPAVDTPCATSTHFDLYFMESMIELHETAISLSEAAIDQAGRVEIADFARTVFRARMAEINIMNALVMGMEATPNSLD